MNFLDALNTKASEVEKPEVLPEGTYIWKVSKLFKNSQTSSGEWDIINIPVTPVMAYADADDVDADALEKFGDVKAGVNSIRFMFPTEADKENDRKRALFNLKRFLLDTLRVAGDEDSTLKELLTMAVGCEFIAQAKHRHDAERDATFVDVVSWMPTDA